MIFSSKLHSFFQFGNYFIKKIPKRPYNLRKPEIFGFSSLIGVFLLRCHLIKPALYSLFAIRSFFTVPPACSVLFYGNTILLFKLFHEISGVRKPRFCRQLFYRNIPLLQKLCRKSKPYINEICNGGVMPITSLNTRDIREWLM